MSPVHVFMARDLICNLFICMFDLDIVADSELQVNQSRIERAQ